MECLNQYSRANPSAALLASAAIALAVVMGAVAQPVNAAEGNHMFCEAGNRKDKVAYFSAIFLSDYPRSTRAKLDFHDYLQDAGKDPDFLSTFCWPGSIYGEDTYEKAKRKLENRVREMQWYPYTDWTIVHTNWKPGYSTPQSPDGTDDTHGRESGGDGCYFGECPDGTNSAPRSPGTPTPSRQTSPGTLICQTPKGWCEMPAALPIGVPCGCSTFSGPVGGITVTSRP